MAVARGLRETEMDIIVHYMYGVSVFQDEELGRGMVVMVAYNVNVLNATELQT